MLPVSHWMWSLLGFYCSITLTGPPTCNCRAWRQVLVTAEVALLLNIPLRLFVFCLLHRWFSVSAPLSSFSLFLCFPPSTGGSGSTEVVLLRYSCYSACLDLLNIEIELTGNQIRSVIVYICMYFELCDDNPASKMLIFQMLPPTFVFKRYLRMSFIFMVSLQCTGTHNCQTW